MPESVEQVKAAALSLLLTVLSHLLLRRDRLNGTMARMKAAFRLDSDRLTIPSGDRRLAAVYVSAGEGTPAAVLCHGIGEVVEYWGTIQELLRASGVSSLAFDYSGYGKSTGYISTTHCEEDAIAAYHELARRGHESVVLVGFSLGSGVACAVASRIDVSGLVLCEAFSTFREAGLAKGFPRWVTRWVPDVWRTVDGVKELDMPVLVVHSDEDRLFPLSMAKRVAEAAGSGAELIVMNGLRHDAPVFAPTEGYWQPIAAWIKLRCSEGAVRRLHPARS